MAGDVAGAEREVRAATAESELLADAGDERHAHELLEPLEPYAGHLGCIGQVGIVGSVDLAVGRLLAHVGRADEARSRLESALRQAEAAGGAPTARRCRAALEGLTDTAR